MASRYWVGGTATWDGTAGTKWALTSGGAGGQAVPTSSDDVFFDANSGAVTVTLNASGNQPCNNLNFTGFTGTIALDSSFRVVFNGSLTLSATMTMSNANGGMTYNGSSGTATITSNGKTFTGSLDFQGVGGTVSLADALVLTSSLTISFSTFLTNNFNVTCASIDCSNSWARTLNLGSSTITVTGTGNSSNAVNLSGTSIIFIGTATISLTSSSARNFVGGGYSLSGMTINQGGSGALTFTGSNTFKDITNTYSATGATTITFTSGTTTKLTQFTATGTVGKVLTVGATAASAATLTKASPWLMGANSTNGGNNTGLTFTAGGGIDYISVSFITGTSTGRYWVGGTGTWNTTSTTNWSTSSGGASGASVPTATNEVFFDQAGTYTVTMTGALACLDMTVSAGTVTLATGTTPTLSVAGSLSTIAGTVWSMTGAVTFTATTSKTLTSGGITINSPFTFNGVGGAWTLQGNFTFGSTLTTTLTAGTLALGTFTLTTGLFASSNSNTRVLAFGTGKIVLNGSATATIWTTATITGLTISGTPLVECQGGGTGVTKTINTGALSEANAISFSLLETAGTATYLFTASSVVKNLIVNNYSGAITLSNSALTIYGSITLGTATYSAGVNAWTLAATSGSYTIISNATTVTWPLTFGSATSTATWTLYDNLSLSGQALTLTNGTIDFNSKTVTSPTLGIIILTGTPTIKNTGSSTITIGNNSFITHTSGTLTLLANLSLIQGTNGYTFTAGTLSLGTYTLTTPIFSSSNSNSRTLDFGTGKIVLYGSATATIWTTATITGLTVSGTPLVECTGSGTTATKTINTGALSEANAISFSLLETAGTVTYTFTASNVVKNLITNGVQTVSNIAITIYGLFTHSTSNGTTTFTAGANAWTFAATSGSYTITNIAGVTYDFPWTFGSATSTAVWTLAANLTLGATRALTLTNGTTDLNNKTVAGPTTGITVLTGSATLTSTGGTPSLAVPITHTSGTLTLGSNITTSGTYTFTSGTNTGTLNLNNFTLTTPIFTTASTAGAKTIAFGTGKIVLNGSATATIWSTSTAASVITTTGTPLVECIGGGTGVTKTILMGSGFAEASAISFSFLETTGTVTYSLNSNVSFFKNLIFNGTQTITNTTVTIYGNFTHLTTNGTTTFTAGTNAWTFGATSGSTTLAFLSGFTYDWPWIFGTNAGTATWTLPYDLTLGSTRYANLNIGTLNLNNFTLSSGQFNFSSTNPRTLAFGTSGQILLTSNNTTILQCSTASSANYTYTGTVRIISTYTGSFGTRTIDPGNSNLVIYTSAAAANGINLGVTATDSISINTSISGGTASFDLTGFTGTLINDARNVGGTVVYPDVATLQVGNNLQTVSSGVNTSNISGGPQILPFPFKFDTTTINLTGNLVIANDKSMLLGAGGVRCNGYTLSAGILNLSSRTTGSFNCAVGGSQIILSGNNTQILVGNTYSTGTNWYTNAIITCNSTSSTGTRSFDFGANVASALPVISTTTGSLGKFSIGNSASDTIAMYGGIGDLDLTGMNSTVIPGTLGNLTVFGNLTVPASGGNLGTSANYLVMSAARGATTANFNGRSADFNFGTVGGLNSSSKKVTLVSNVTFANTRTFYMAGASDQGDFTFSDGTVLSVGNFVCNTSSGATQILAFGNTGQMVLTGNNKLVFSVTTSSLSVTGNIYINITSPGATGTRTINAANTGGTTIPYWSVTTNTSSGNRGLILEANPSDIITFTTNSNIGNLDLTNFTGNLTFPTSLNVGGNLVIPATVGTLVGGNTCNVYMYANTGFISNAAIVNTNSRTMPFNLLSVGGTTPWVRFDSNYQTSFNQFAPTRGNWDLNGQSITVPYANFNGCPNIYFAPGSTITISGNSTSGNGFAALTSNFAGNVQVLITATSIPEIVSGAPNGTTGVIPNLKFASTFISNTVVVQPTSGNLNFRQSFNDIDFTNCLSTSNVTFNNLNIYGNFSMPVGAGNVIVGTGPFTFGSTSGTKTIDFSGRTIDYPWTFNGVGGNWSLSNSANANIQLLTLSNGSLDLNGKTLTFGTFVTGTGTKNITFNGGTLSMATSSVLAWNANVPAGFTCTAGTGTGKISMTGSTAKTFVGGDINYNAALDQGGAGNLTVTGNNQFKDIRFSYNVANSNIILPASGTTNVEAFTGSGTASTKLLGLYSSTANTRTTLNLVTANTKSSADYILAKDINFTPFVTDGTGPMVWYVGNNSINNMNNYGALFTTNTGNIANTPTVYMVRSGTTWVVPSGWNSSNNKIHLFGAGGGGGAAKVSGSLRAGGGGGGGGGYTVLANFVSSSGASITYNIGDAGANVLNADGANGGNTTWSSGTYTAGGGGGGTATLGTGTASSAGGFAGVGSTYNGGNGGAGSASTVTNTGDAGGAGGGAGGVFGKGGNGGVGFASTTQASIAGGGGGGYGGGQAGANGASATGGIGGNNFYGNGGGAAATKGQLGGGGGGGFSSLQGGQGSVGIDIFGIGGGSGAGGSAGGGGTSAGTENMGAGGGGGSLTTAGAITQGGSGASGGIIIVYYYSNASTSGMFFVF